MFSPNAVHQNWNVKNINKLALLDLIRFSPAGMSRAEIARKLSISRAAVSSIVNDLIEHQLIKESDSTTNIRGRRPVILELNPGFGYLVGIDLGATHLRIILTDFNAQVIEDLEIEIDITSDPDDTLKVIIDRLDRIITNANIPKNKIAGLGFGVPGPVQGDGSTVVSPPIMPGWGGYPIRDKIKGFCDCPVAVGNDADLGALGEWALGAGRGEDFVLYIKVGTGIGMGLLINGKIYQGASGSAGEIGHITIDEDGPLCSCGNYGCLEAIAGGNAISIRANKLIESGERTILRDPKRDKPITAKDVALAAEKGDHLAQQIISEAGNYIGIAVANVINLFNPGIVVVGGGVAQVGDLLLEPIRFAIKERSLVSASKAVRINSSVLGRRSTGMGAITTAQKLAINEYIFMQFGNGRR